MRAERARGFLHGDVENGIEVELDSELSGDTRDQPLALERLPESGRGSQPVERERGLVAESLEQAELVRRERPWPCNAREGQHAEHFAFGEERDESDALQACALDEPAADER